MAKRQGLDDIIRDAIKGQRTRGRNERMKDRLPRINDDITTDPLGSIRRPRKNIQEMPKRKPSRKQKPNVSEKAANKGKWVRVPKPKGDRRMYAMVQRVYGSGQKGGMR